MRESRRRVHLELAGERIILDVPAVPATKGCSNPSAGLNQSQTFSIIQIDSKKSCSPPCFDRRKSIDADVFPVYLQPIRPKFYTPVQICTPPPYVNGKGNTLR